MNLPLCAFMATNMAVMSVPAFDRFCERNPEACMTTGSINKVNLDEKTWSKIKFINTFVNHSTIQKNDIDVYGTSDYWEIADGQGDCEDIALKKQKELVRNGFSQSDLLLTVVKDEHDQGHAVLTLRTNQGDYVLDNKTDEIKLWYQTPYRFYSRQSYRDYKLWVKIDGCSK